MKERRVAKKKPVTAWTTGDIGLSALPESKVTLKRLFEPELKASNCSMITGVTLAEAGRNLAVKLKEDGVL